MDAEPQTILYFDEPGPQNTQATLKAALRRARQLDLKTVVVATDTGKSAREVLHHFGSDFKVVAVTNPAGVQLPVSKLHDYLPRFMERKKSLIDQGIAQVPVSLTDQTLAELGEAGARVHRLDWQRVAQYARSGLNALDRIGVATRVALTVAIWAFLADEIAAGEEVVAVAGTGFGGGGADTALIVRAGQSMRDWRVLETVCRPRESPPSE